MPFTPEDKQAMDDAAVDAENDLTEHGAVAEEALTAVADWWAKWVMKAGHRRLGRILLQYKTKGG